jgi:FixJ family two-component response regulator
MNRRRRTSSTRKTRKWATTPRRGMPTNRMKSWTPQEVSTLRKIYRTNPNAYIAKQLGRSEGSVQYKASSLGLRKSPTYLKQIRNNWA